MTPPLDVDPGQGEREAQPLQELLGSHLGRLGCFVALPRAPPEGPAQQADDAHQALHVGRELDGLLTYFPLVVVFCQKYVKGTGIGTLMALMLPYPVTFLVAWSLFLLAQVVGSFEHEGGKAGRKSQ